MSLYNNIADSLAGKGLMGAINSGITSGLNSIGGSAIAALGGGKLAQAAVNAATSAAGQAAKQFVNKHIPPALRSKLDAGARVLGSAMDGNWEDAGMAALEGGLFDDLLSTLSGSANQVRIMGKRSPLVGGGTLKNAIELTQAVVLGDHARKNLFIIEVESLASGDYSEPFNLFAVDVDYDPFNISGDKLKLGGSVVDRVTGQEAVEMRLTTYDDAYGTLKRFWAQHHGAAVSRDGTVGVPSNYAIRIKLLHGVIKGGNRVSSAYMDKGLFRVSTLSSSLSRRDPGLQELQMTLTQIDTFMKA